MLGASECDISASEVSARTKPTPIKLIPKGNAHMERLPRLLDASAAYEHELTNTITVTMAMMMPTIEPPEPLAAPPPRWPISHACFLVGVGAMHVLKI